MRVQLAVELLGLGETGSPDHKAQRMGPLREQLSVLRAPFPALRPSLRCHVPRPRC